MCYDDQRGFQPVSVLRPFSVHLFCLFFHFCRFLPSAFSVSASLDVTQSRVPSYYNIYGLVSSLPFSGKWLSLMAMFLNPAPPNSLTFSVGGSRCSLLWLSDFAQAIQWGILCSHPALPSSLCHCEQDTPSPRSQMTVVMIPIFSVSFPAAQQRCEILQR